MSLDPKLVVSFAVAGTLDVVLALALVLFARRKLGVPWVVMGLGALAFAASQLFTRVPLTILGQVLLQEQLKSSVTLQWVWLAVLAITAGLFEETARYLCFSRGLKSESNWKNAVGLGAGHGGLEAVLLVGGLTFVNLMGAATLARLDPSTMDLPADKLAQLEQARAAILALRWWEPLLSTWERVCSMGLHVALSVLVLQRFVRGSMRWYWLAVAFHAVANAAAVFWCSSASARSPPR